MIPAFNIFRTSKILIQISFNNYLIAGSYETLIFFKKQVRDANEVENKREENALICDESSKSMAIEEKMVIEPSLYEPYMVFIKNIEVDISKERFEDIIIHNWKCNVRGIYLLKRKNIKLGKAVVEFEDYESVERALNLKTYQGYVKVWIIVRFRFAKLKKSSLIRL